MATLPEAWHSEFQHGRFADTLFKIEGQSIKLCSLPFAIASPVFAAMLFPDPLTSHTWREHDSRVVELPDVALVDFLEIAKYVYGVSGSITPHNVCEVRKIADKYQMNELVRRCDEAIVAFLGSPDDTMWVLNSAMHIDSEISSMVHQAAVRSGNKLLEAILRHHDPTLDVLTLEWFLSSNAVLEEDLVWMACHKWGTCIANKVGGTWQEAVRPLVDLIRMPVISQRLLDHEIIGSGLLSRDQEVAILLHARGSKIMPGFRGLRYGFDLAKSQCARNHFSDACKTVTVAAPERRWAWGCENDIARIVQLLPGLSPRARRWTIVWKQCGKNAALGLIDSDKCSVSMERKGKSKGYQPLMDALSPFFAPTLGFGHNLCDFETPQQEGLRVEVTVDMSAWRKPYVMFESKPPVFRFQQEVTPSNDSAQKLRLAITTLLVEGSDPGTKANVFHIESVEDLFET